MAEEDIRWMRLALEQAQAAVGLTSPNPPVGAVVVRDDEVIGCGRTQPVGGAHAEVGALGQAGDATHGATVYVTLEPCSSHGRTPPCTDALVAAGVKRVVWATDDPDPRHVGRAAEVLGAAGIAVECGVLGEEAREILRPFTKRVATGLPWVIAKSATSADGRISRPPGGEQWLTSEAAREDAHFLRAASDAILVGANTVRTDNPALTIRGTAHRAEKPQPWRGVMTRDRAALPDDARLLTDEYADRTRVFENRTPKQVLEELADLGCNTVLLEGGGSLIGSFFAEGLVDEVVLYLAPLWCGLAGTPASGETPLPASIALTPWEVTPLAPDVKLRARVIKD